MRNIKEALDAVETALGNVTHNITGNIYHYITESDSVAFFNMEHVDYPQGVQLVRKIKGAEKIGISGKDLYCRSLILALRHYGVRDIEMSNVTVTDDEGESKTMFGLVITAPHPRALTELAEKLNKVSEDLGGFKEVQERAAKTHIRYVLGMYEGIVGKDPLADAALDERNVFGDPGYAAGSFSLN